MDEFLDGSLVLPPGDWDEDMLLPAMHQRNNQLRLKGQISRSVDPLPTLIIYTGILHTNSSPETTLAFVLHV